MIYATQVVLAEGGTLILEPGEDRCWASEEVFEQVIEVEAGTKCDLCGEEIGAAAEEVER